MPNKPPNELPTRTIIQLPTARDTAPMPSSTKHRYRGPSTLLQTVHPDGGIDTFEMDYDPHATVASCLERMRVEYERRRAADLIATS